MRKLAVCVFVLIMLIISALLLNNAPIDIVGLAPAQEPQEATARSLAAADETSKGNLRLIFSHAGYFYSDTINVEIFASNPDAEIYYTTDGKEPTSTSQKYSDALVISKGTDVNVVVLKAIAVVGDIVSNTHVHTYFIGKVDSFDTLVFSLSTDPEHLYNYDTGIFVEGRLRNDFEKENPGHEIIPPDPANFNLRGMEGERPVYVEVFTQEGSRVISQAAGVRVSGGWSRAAEYKSIRLIARKEYEPGIGKFHYGFFHGDSKKDGDETPITEYDTIVLRNGANDRDFGILRNEASSNLAADAGFREVTPARAAAVYINGEYYGFAWLQININEQYLQDIYSAPTKEFDIVGDSEQWPNTEDIEAKASIEELNSYANKSLRNYYLFGKLEELVDIDNLLLYYAFQIYIGNEDWPQNNLKLWRYTGPKVEGAAPELDGRWRYIMYDLDWVFGLYGEDYTKPTFQNVLEGNNKRSPLLASILKRKDMAQKFTTILCDIASNIVTKDTVQGYVRQLYGEAAHEFYKAFQARKYSEWVTLNTIIDNHHSIAKFAEKRATYIYDSLRKYFGYSEYMYEVNVTGGSAVIGTQRGTSVKYFGDINATVSPSLDEFEVFDHWILNGKTVTTPEITVSAADAVSDSVNLELVKHIKYPALAFTEAYTSSIRNGCVIMNMQDKSVNTAGYYLSDSRDNLFRWALPGASVAPGETLTLVGKGSTDIRDLFKIQIGFKVKSGRVLYLSNEDGVVLHKIVVSD